MTRRPAIALSAVAILLVLTLAAACGDGGSQPRQLDPVDPACRYRLTDRTAGTETPTRAFPPGLFPLEQRELGSGLSVTLLDPNDPSQELVLTVPQCKLEEALRTIEERRQADEEQAEAGIPFEEQEY